VNARNRRVTPKYDYEGKSLVLGDWAEVSGIPYRTLKYRIRNGWTIGRAVTQPAKECRSRPGREPLSRAKVSQLSGRRIAIVCRNADIRGAKTRLAQRGRWRVASSGRRLR
jgi:hypothetical protein